LFRLAGGVWESWDVPVRGPRAIAGRAANDLWLAGESGVAHFDGREWTIVSSVPGPLSFVALVGQNVWLAGATGAFVGSAPAS
jgi:hypothetical protein